MRVHAGYHCDQCTEVHETWTALRRHVACEHRITPPTISRRPKPEPKLDPFSSPALLARLSQPPTALETALQLEQLHTTLELKARSRVLTARHRCPTPGCACVYMNARSLRAHILRRHSPHEPSIADADDEMHATADADAASQPLNDDELQTLTLTCATAHSSSAGDADADADMSRASQSLLSQVQVIEPELPSIDTFELKQEPNPELLFIEAQERKTELLAQQGDERQCQSSIQSPLENACAMESLTLVPPLDSLMP